MPEPEALPDYWFVLVCGLPLEEDSFQLGQSVTLQRLHEPLTVFDLASVGAVGFQQWALLEPLAQSARAELISSTHAADGPGFDALNKCWLASALMVLRGYIGHLCPAASSYSWNLVAGHQAATAGHFKDQMKEEGVEKAVYEPRASLPRFRGSLLDFHVRVLAPGDTRRTPFNNDDAEWFRGRFESFNRLAATDERFRFALGAAVDWRFATDMRAAIARIWAGIESLFNVNSELVYRISLMTSTVLAPRGEQLLQAFAKVRGLYGIRSKAVHGEVLSDEKLTGALDDSFNILRHLLLDAVERGSVRTVADYESEILG